MFIFCFCKCQFGRSDSYRVATTPLTGEKAEKGKAKTKDGDTNVKKGKKTKKQKKADLDELKQEMEMVGFEKDSSLCWRWFQMLT